MDGQGGLWDSGTILWGHKNETLFLHPLQIITAIVISNYIVTFSIQSIHLVSFSNYDWAAVSNLTL